MNVHDIYKGKYKVASDGRILSTVGKEKELVGKVTGKRYIKIHIGLLLRLLFRIQITYQKLITKMEIN
ncbi:hypothetical protein [Siminovitchia fordii]|uniref:Uncharacterized protein n=1 Tax=Siminovitchia fordii TaxID=254759 RepID=A0ABQ4KA93_9BACI|nr:hypothetical protein [Siminovitchia fordii]GIN22526.1 hypothetical protein J1TS3_36600 [Siminovitchia fordii]